MTQGSSQRRDDVIDALRAGAVPTRGLDLLAVGLDRFEPAILQELEKTRGAGSVFKAVRGDYGCGKTFFSRWLQEKAKRMGFATAEVQISETETPLHRLETVYRRIIERLSTSAVEGGALRPIIDSWFYTLEEDVLASGEASENDTEKLLQATEELMERRLAGITQSAPLLGPALRSYRRAVAAGDASAAEALLGWIGAQPNVGSKYIRQTGMKSTIDHFGALSFLQGLLLMLRDSGHAGLVIVLDEVETLQRMRGDVREKALNALRQWIDEIHGGRFPGLFLLITGTPAFFDGPQGIRRLQPLAERLHVEFGPDTRFDNPRAVQIRLRPFDTDSLVQVGRRVRDLYAAGSTNEQRVRAVCDDGYLSTLATRVTGSLGGKIGITPRLFLKKLVGEVLDRIDQYPDFDPRQHYSLTISATELNDIERTALSVDEIDLPL